MEFWVLAENTSLADNLPAEHGLSLYIKAAGHTLLFDMGQTDLFARNADALGLDLAAVDTAILSHGHYDHGGGMATFLARNDRAKIYAQAHAFEDHISEKPGMPLRYIGLDTALMENARIVKTGNLFKIDDTMTLFSGVTGGACLSGANADLRVRAGAGLEKDDFRHEQNLILTENGRDYLISGCSHAGIVNILEACRGIAGRDPSAVIGGFHLCMYDEVTDEALPREMAARLLAVGAKYYTGHCTGLAGYGALRREMGERVERLSVGAHFAL